MAIVKYPVRSPAFSAWREIDEPFNRLARLFDESSQRANGGMWSPPVGVSESQDEIVLTAELPGLTEDQIQIELENNVLSISGEKSEERTEADDKRRYHVRERSYGSFKRSFTLPRRVSGDEVAATFENGVLSITLPKSPEAKGRRIEIAKPSA